MSPNCNWHDIRDLGRSVPCTSGRAAHCNLPSVSAFFPPNGEIVWSGNQHPVLYSCAYHDASVTGRDRLSPADTGSVNFRELIFGEEV